jgi:hypothetical protein
VKEFNWLPFTPSGHLLGPSLLEVVEQAIDIRRPADCVVFQQFHKGSHHLAIISNELPVVSRQAKKPVYAA